MALRGDSVDGIKRIAPVGVTRETRERERAGDAVRTVKHELSPRTVFVIIGIVVAVWLLSRVWQSLLIFVVALVLAGAFSPVVTLLERRGFKRVLALGMVFIALLGTVVGIGVLAVPVIFGQVGQLIANAPALQAQAADLVAQLPVVSGYAGTIRSTPITDLLAPIGGSALEIAAHVAEIIVLAATTVVLAFYLVADHERVQGLFFSLLPRGFHLRTARILLDMETVVGGYVRGQLLICLCMGLYAFTLCTLVGVPNALAIGVVAGFANLIPFAGGIVGLVPAALLALTLGPTQTAIVVVGFIVYHQIEGHIIIPRIYGQSLRLSPVAVLMALILGGQLLGVVGALLSLPLAAGIRVLVEDLRIELPGEIAGEPSLRAAAEEAEAAFAAQTEGSSSLESAVVATAVAEQQQQQQKAETGAVEAPAEEQADPPLTPTAYSNPART